MPTDPPSAEKLAKRACPLSHPRDGDFSCGSCRGIQAAIEIAEQAAAKAAREEMRERCAAACERISEGDGMAFAEMIRAIDGEEEE